MDRFGGRYSDGRFSDSLSLDLDGGIGGGVEAGAEFRDLSAYYG
jgi:hypothetical protein